MTPSGDPRSSTPSSTRRVSRRSELARLAVWPIGLLLLLIALATWQGHGGAGGRDARDDTGRGGGSAPRPELRTRRFGALRLDVPVGWVTLDRSSEHITWGEPGRGHTVTLASTEASVLPLPGVVAAVSRDSEAAIPGAEPDGAPVAIDVPGHAPRDDAAMLARFVVHSEDGDLRVAQAWRRDARGGVDIVATWTSVDGAWPVDPRDGVPPAAASG